MHSQPERICLIFQRDTTYRQTRRTPTRHLHLGPQSTSLDEKLDCQQRMWFESHQLFSREREHWWDTPIPQNRRYLRRRSLRSCLVTVSPLDFSARIIMPRMVVPASKAICDNSWCWDWRILRVTWLIGSSADGTADAASRVLSGALARFFTLLTRKLDRDHQLRLAHEWQKVLLGHLLHQQLGLSSSPALLRHLAAEGLLFVRNKVV